MKQQYEHSSSVVRGTKNFMSQVPPLNQFIQCFIGKCFRLKCNPNTFGYGINFYYKYK